MPHDQDATENWYAEESATLGDRLTAAREGAGLTPEALATRVGVSEATLESWEADMSEPRANRLSTLAGVLNVSLMWLLTGEGDGLDAPPGEEAVVPKADVSAILAEVRALRDDAARTAERLGLLEARLEAVTRAA